MKSLPEAEPFLKSEVINLLSEKGDRRGLCLVLGIDDGQIAFEIASRSRLDVIAFDESQRDVTKYRNLLQIEEFYGRKNNVHFVKNMNKLPVASELANLVWVEDISIVDPDEVIRLIAPLGEAVVKGSNLKKWMDSAHLSWQVDVEVEDPFTWLLAKHPIENSGNWTHQYAQADNSDFGGESLWGSTSNVDFEVQWIGRPGPRFQTDRSGRKPSPLAAGGRLFVQGNERVVALDAYNGHILWSKEFPGFLRMNIPRDCSNWAADQTHLYLAINSNLTKVDQENGFITEIFPSEDSQDQRSDWGYIGVLPDRIIGSRSPVGSHFTNFDGLDGWYDTKDGPLAHKVISENLFALSKDGNQEFWSYQSQGVIINSTITIFKDQICFVESRTRNLKLSDEGRGGDDLFESTFLVALDVISGEKRWEQKIRIEPGLAACYMAAGNDHYVIVSSGNGNFHIYAFKVFDGTMSSQVQKPLTQDNNRYIN